NPPSAASGKPVLLSTGLNPESTSSFRPDPELLDERPPLLGSGPHQRAECLGCLSFPRKNVQSEIDETRLHGRLGQCLHGPRIDLANDVPGRAPGREKRVPPGEEGKCR